MRVWLIQANEPMPMVDSKQRYFRTGMTAQELDKREHEIVWFAATFDHYTKRQRFTSNKLISVNSRYHVQFLYGNTYEKNISIKRIINHIQLAKNFKKIIKTLEKPDIIYCSFPTISLAQECVDYGNQQRIPVIIDVRDLWPEVFYRVLPENLSWLAKALFSSVNRKVINILKNADGIHSISKECLNYVLEKIGRIQNNLDKEYFIGYSKKYEIDPAIKQLGLDKKLIIPFVGTLGSQINYKKIIELSKQVNGRIEFVICGSGPLENDFRKLAQGCQNIRFVGWIDADEIRDYMSKAFLALIPYNDTFDFQMGAGNKFGEALCYSLPVILFCEGVMEKLVNEYRCGYYDSNVIEIGKFINKLSCDQELYKEKVQNAHRLYKEKFCSELIYSNLVDCLEIIEKERRL